MTLPEVLASGKKFKRPIWGKFVTLEENNMFHINDIVAKDWQVEQPTITVTEVDLNDLMNKITIRSADMSIRQVADAWFKARLK